MSKVEKLLEQGKASIAKKKEDKKAKKAARKEKQAELASQTSKGLRVKHDKIGNGSKVVNAAGATRSVTYPIPESLQGDFKDLKTAKAGAKDESRAHRQPIYINVLGDGSFNYSTKYDKDSSLHCFRNGSEVAMIVTKQSEPKENNKQMATTTKGKPAKKAAVKSNVKVEGTKKEMKVKDIIAGLKKGQRIVNKKGRLFNAKKLAAKSPDLIRLAFIQKA